MQNEDATGIRPRRERIYHGDTEARSRDCLKSGFVFDKTGFQATACHWRMKGDGCTNQISCFLQNTTGFVKFGRSETLISNLTSPPLVFLPCLGVSVVILF